MAAIELSTLQAEIRCLSLWNAGAGTNDAAPTGWSDPSFDDSAWPVSANPTIANGSGNPPVQFSRVTPHLFMSPLAALPAGVEAIWPTSTVLHPNQHAVFRWHITMPATRVGTQAEFFMPGNEGGFGPGIDYRLNGGFAYFNLAAFGDFSFGNLAGYISFINSFQPGDNLLAFYVDNSHYSPDAPGLGSVFSWGTTAWIGLRFTINATGGSRGFAQVVG